MGLRYDQRRGREEFVTMRQLAGLVIRLALSLVVAEASAGAQVVTAPSVPLSSKARLASLEEYRAHLSSLTTLVEACAKARDMKSCDPTQVGPDDEVPLTAAQDAPRRLIRYGWLRVLMSKAQDKDASLDQKKTSTKEAQSWEDVRPTPPTTSQLLIDAQTRLTSDQAQAQAAAPAPESHAAERAVMKQVLAGREFGDLEETTGKDSALEKVGGWLNRALESAMRASARAPWLGRALVWGFILAVCVGLVWGLLQLERRWRVRLVPEERGPATGTASAIPWQTWLEDARRAATAGQWREAIHFLYWASISRLESRRLWPADRARTPREYLALVAEDDPRRSGLSSLTGSFERVWYGGRGAGHDDYERAEVLATALIGGASAGGGVGAGRGPEGGQESGGRRR